MAMHNEIATLVGPTDFNTACMQNEIIVSCGSDVRNRVWSSYNRSASRVDLWSVSYVDTKF